MDYVLIAFSVTFGVYACKGILGLLGFLTRSLIELFTIAIVKYKTKKKINKMKGEIKE